MSENDEPQGPIVSVSEDSTAAQREAIIKLVELRKHAIKLRSLMDLCIQYARLEDMIANGMLVEATMAYSTRAQCSLTDAREYIAKVVAARGAQGVSSESTPIHVAH